MARRGIESLFNEFEQSVLDAQEFNRSVGEFVSIADEDGDLADTFTKVVVRLPAGGIFTEAEYAAHFSNKCKLESDFSKTSLVELEFSEDKFDYLLLLVGNNGTLSNNTGEYTLTSKSLLRGDSLQQSLTVNLGGLDISSFGNFNNQ